MGTLETLETTFHGYGMLACPDIPTTSQSIEFVNSYLVGPTIIAAT